MNVKRQKELSDNMWVLIWSLIATDLLIKMLFFMAKRYSSSFDFSLIFLNIWLNFDDYRISYFRSNKMFSYFRYANKCIKRECFLWSRIPEAKLLIMKIAGCKHCKAEALLVTDFNICALEDTFHLNIYLDSYKNFDKICHSHLLHFQ